MKPPYPVHVAEGYVAARPGMRALRARISPWRVLVAGSAVLLAAAAIVMLVLWFTGTGERSSSLAFAGPLLGVELDVGRGNVQILGGGRSDIHIRRTDRFA